MPIAIPAMLKIACRGLIFHMSKAGKTYLKKLWLIIVLSIENTVLHQVNAVSGCCDFSIVCYQDNG